MVAVVPGREAPRNLAWLPPFGADAAFAWDALSDCGGSAVAGGDEEGDLFV